ncbi:MAG TPA: pyridoxal-phosphate dependent enzyme, partial [Bryobacteraceae bacterium]|nr:pyridoxal-phosphate dependent enzyme [Bryobacteraceae bacterium]
SSLGIPATLVMPVDAPRSKMEATRGYGANIVTYDRLTDDREAIGQRIATETGAILVPPYDHPWTIAGQGTAALELLTEIPDLDALVVCLGGGGLASGSAIAAKTLRPGIRVFGVEPADGNDFWLSRQKGDRVTIPPPTTIADGLRAQTPGQITWPIVQRLVDDLVTVGDEEIGETMRLLLTRMKILAEPSGAVAAAAVLHHKLPRDFGRTGIIISGGNVDSDVLKQVL